LRTTPVRHPWPRGEGSGAALAGGSGLVSSRGGRYRARGSPRQRLRLAQLRPADAKEDRALCRSNGLGPSHRDPPITSAYHAGPGRCDTAKTEGFNG
jgi:hypothetical protein